MVKLGVNGDGALAALELLAPYHLAIQGASRSGKSTTLYRLLGSIATDPNILVAGCDPSSILLSPWVNHPGSNLRCLGMKDPTRHVTVTDLLIDEMDRRISSLVSIDKGSFRDKIEDFTPELPLIIVVLEEYPGLLATVDSLGKELKTRFRLNIRRLIQEGAKVGFRIIMVAQRFDASIIGGAERSNLAVRITHRVDNSDAVKMLHVDAAPEIISEIKNFAPGMAFMEMPGEPSRIFRAYLTSYQDYSTRVFQASKISDHGKTS